MRANICMINTLDALRRQVLVFIDHYDLNLVFDCDYTTYECGFDTYLKGKLAGT